MKKNYTKPDMTVVELKQKYQLLTESNPQGGGEGYASDMLFDSDFE